MSDWTDNINFQISQQNIHKQSGKIMPMYTVHNEGEGHFGELSPYNKPLPLNTTSNRKKGNWAICLRLFTTDGKYHHRLSGVRISVDKPTGTSFMYPYLPGSRLRQARAHMYILSFLQL